MFILCHFTSNDNIHLKRNKTRKRRKKKEKNMYYVYDSKLKDKDHRHTFLSPRKIYTKSTHKVKDNFNEP